MGLLEDIETLISSIQSPYLGDIPDTPDNIICLFQTGGASPVHTFTSKEFEQPTFQVRVRDSDYVNGINKCESIKEALDGQTGLVINSHTYISIFQQGDILSLGYDEKNRAEFSINFRCKVKR